MYTRVTALQIPLPELTALLLLDHCRFFYASSACVYPEYRQLETTIEGGGLKEDTAWPAQVCLLSCICSLRQVVHVLTRCSLRLFTAKLLVLLAAPFSLHLPCYVLLFLTAVLLVCHPAGGFGHSSYYLFASPFQASSVEIAVAFPCLTHSSSALFLKNSSTYLPFSLPCPSSQPQDAYGLEKLATEELCKHYNADFGMECRMARYHNIYGPYGTWKGGREKAPAAFSRKVLPHSLCCC